MCVKRRIKGTSCLRRELRGDEDLYTAMLNDLILNHTLNFIAKETKNKEKVALKMFLLFRLMAILKFWECNLTGLINYVKGITKSLNAMLRLFLSSFI